jgi:hypothetical protein
MTTKPFPVRIVVIAMLQGILGSVALACGFDGLIGDKFSAQHPKSLPVAFAITDAVGSGIIGKGALEPIQPGQKGYWRAMTRLANFAALLGDRTDSSRLPNVSILLIDSQLWTRLRGGSTGFEIEAHARGPELGDAVIVTNEFILAAIIEGDLSAGRALQIGVVAVDGDRAPAAWVKNQMSRGIAPGKMAPERKAVGKLVSPWGSTPAAFH